MFTSYFIFFHLFNTYYTTSPEQGAGSQPSSEQGPRTRRGWDEPPVTPGHYKCRWVEAPRTVKRSEIGSEQESLQWREGGSPPAMAQGRQGVRQRDPWGTSREGQRAAPCEGSAGGAEVGAWPRPKSTVTWTPRTEVRLGHTGWQAGGGATHAGWSRP